MRNVQDHEFITPFATVALGDRVVQRAANQEQATLSVTNDAIGTHSLLFSKVLISNYTRIARSFRVSSRHLTNWRRDNSLARTNMV